MPEEAIEEKTIQRASMILKNLGLEMDDLSGRKTLDLGSGSSDLAKAAFFLKPDANIVSLDVSPDEAWIGLPNRVKQKSVLADAEKLPFKEASFDFVLAHCSIRPDQMEDALRVLKPGGQLRIFPIGGQILEYWNIAYYMERHLGKSQEETEETIYAFDSDIEKHDGAVPLAYKKLREVALNTLSSAEKCGVLEMMVDRYEELSGLTLDYQIKDPSAHEPNGVIIYTKP